MPISPISLGLRSNPGRTAAISAARLINCYAEDAGEEGKIRFPIVACDGFEAWSSSFSGVSGSGTNRGGIVLSDSAMYVASGTRIIKLNTSGSPTALAAKSATVTITIASPAVVTWTGHGLEAGAAFVPTTTGALPTGLTAGTTYYVISTGLGADSFQISATPGGSAVNTTGSQSGTHTGTAGAGTISSTGLVTFARNRKEPNAQIGIVSSAGTFYILENDTLVDYSGLITSLGSAGTLQSLDAIDGYFLLFFDNGEFFASSVDEGGEIDTLDFAKAESNPDGGLRNIRRGRDMLFFGPRSVEAWYNSGATDFPFERTATADIGCYAAGSVVALTGVIDNRTVDTVIWAATNSEGAYAGVMMLVDGLAGVKISTGDLDRQIEAVSDPTTIRAFTWSRGGHTFYAITDLSTFTWTYDTTTRLPVERTSSGLNFWRISNALRFGTKIIVADYILAKLYWMKAGLYDADNASTVTLKHSKDNGNNWVTRTAKTLSGSSNLTQRMKWNRLGQTKSQGKLFNLTISHAVMEDGTANSMTIQPPAVIASPGRLRFYQVYVDTIPGGSQTATPKGVTGMAANIKQLAA